MNRISLRRAAGVFVLAVGLLLGLFANAASAQVAMTGPGAQIQAAGGKTPASSAGVKGDLNAGASSNQVGAANECGWYKRGADSYYRHCGPNRWILLRVEFTYEMQGAEHVWATWGVSHLSYHFRDHSGFITAAYCVRNC